MDILSRTDLRRMLEAEGQVCISVYLPTNRRGAEGQQGPIRLKNLIRETEKTLEQRGFEKSGSGTLLGPIRALVQDRDFWQHQAAGLAIFRSPDFFKYYRLDLSFQELAIAGPKFHLKPVFPRITSGGRFYVLALSQKHARFFRASREQIVEIEPLGMPDSLSDALNWREPEHYLHAHSASHFQPGSSALIFHGHGEGEDNKKDELLTYFHQIDRGIGDFFAGERAPLVLAAVDYLYPLYRQASSKADLLEEWVSGNPDALSPRELHERALRIVSAHFEQARKKTVEQYLESWNTRRASNRLEDVLPAAHKGKVHALFVAVGTQICGRFDSRNGEIALSDETVPGAQDLLNLAAVETFANGGTVYAVPPQEVPGGKPLAAVFRF